jgi:hypothetical protein
VNLDDRNQIDSALASGHLAGFVRTGRLMRIHYLCNEVEQLCGQFLHGPSHGRWFPSEEEQAEEVWKQGDALVKAREMKQKAEEISQHAREFCSAHET